MMKEKKNKEVDIKQLNLQLATLRAEKNRMEE